MLRDTDRPWYLSDLAQHLGVRPSSLQRELAALTDAGILRSYRDRNRVYYQADTDCPVLPELRSLFMKTTGLADILRDTLEPFASDIDCAFIYGSIARGEQGSESDVDVMVIGQVPLVDLASALREVERTIGRPVNVTLYTSREFSEKRAGGHSFLRQVVESPKIFLKASDDELECLAGGATSPTP